MDFTIGLAVSILATKNARMSVDVLHALTRPLLVDSSGCGRSLEGGRNPLTYFASLRCPGLVEAGKGSMLPNAPKWEGLKSLIRLLIPRAALLLDRSRTWAYGPSVPA